MSPQFIRSPLPFQHIEKHRGEDSWLWFFSCWSQAHLLYDNREGTR